MEKCRRNRHTNFFYNRIKYTPLLNHSSFSTFAIHIFVFTVGHWPKLQVSTWLYLYCPSLSKYIFSINNVYAFFAHMHVCILRAGHTTFIGVFVPFITDASGFFISSQIYAHMLTHRIVYGLLFIDWRKMCWFLGVCVCMCVWVWEVLLAHFDIQPNVLNGIYRTTIYTFQQNNSA